MFEQTFADSDKSWTVDAKEVDRSSFDLSVKNSSKEEETLLREPQEILKEIAELDAESARVLSGIREML